MIRIILFFVFFLFTIVYLPSRNILEAIQAPPMPYCQVTAEIVGSVNPISGVMTIKIISILNQSGTTRYGDCNTSYPVNSEQGIYLPDNNDILPKVGQKIKTTLNYRGDEYTHGTYASDISIQDNKDTAWLEMIIAFVKNIFHL